MLIELLRALADNYIFMILHDALPEAAVVDPAESGPVLSYLQRTHRRLTAILNTHHHHDHVGGNIELLAHYPGIPVFGGARDKGRIPGQTAFLEDNDEVSVCGVKARVLAVPGHTRAHLAYFFDAGDLKGGDLFSGDTVFGGTIGNLFEGTPGMMFESIKKIRLLPVQTRIWCSHEYTLQYVREAAALDPRNPRLAERLQLLERRSAASDPTVPLTLEEECATNPFFRWDDPALAGQMGTQPGIGTFRRLCEIT